MDTVIFIGRIAAPDDALREGKEQDGGDTGVSRTFDAVP